MPSCFSCFGSSSLVLSDHSVLTRGEVSYAGYVAIKVSASEQTTCAASTYLTQLKDLYDMSLVVNNGRLIVHGETVWARALALRSDAFKE